MHYRIQHKLSMARFRLRQQWGMLRLRPGIMRQSATDFAVLILAILLILSVDSWLYQKDAKDTAQRQTIEVEAMLATCMSGGGLLSKEENIVYLCDTVYPIPISR